MRLLAILFLLIAVPALAANVYVAQTSAGGNTGADCADARALSTLVAGDWVAGNTIHLCGTITATAGTSGLVAQGSGTSGSPIIVKFEANAILESTYFGYSNGCFSLGTCLGGIEVFGYNYIIIDGGTNGIIQNTADGTDLANQQSSSGITLSGSNYIVRNLTIRNIYANDPTTGADFGGNYTADVTVLAGSSNVSICNNTLDNSHSGVQLDTAGGAGPTYPLPSCASNTFTAGTNLYGNTLFDHAWQINPTGSSSPIVNIFNNSMGGTTNWIYTVNPPVYYHTDGIITYGGTPGGQIVDNIFNNTFVNGDFQTAAIYCTYGVGEGGSACNVYNNVFDMTDYPNLVVAVGLSNSASYETGPYAVYNNTFIDVEQGISTAQVGAADLSLENNIFDSTTNSQASFYVANSGSLTSLLTASDYNNFYGGRGLSFYGTSWYCWPQTGGNPTGCGASYNGPWASTAFDNHSISGNPNLSGYLLTSGSPAIGAATNLTSLCSTIAPLCYDAAGNARPATGAWDVGAYNHLTGVNAGGSFLGFQ